MKMCKNQVNRIICLCAEFIYLYPNIIRLKLLLKSNLNKLY